MYVHVKRIKILNIKGYYYWYHALRLYVAYNVRVGGRSKRKKLAYLGMVREDSILHELKFWAKLWTRQLPQGLTLDELLPAIECHVPKPTDAATSTSSSMSTGKTGCEGYRAERRAHAAYHGLQDPFVETASLSRTAYQVRWFTVGARCSTRPRQRMATTRIAGTSSMDSATHQKASGSCSPGRPATFMPKMPVISVIGRKTAVTTDRI